MPELRGVLQHPELHARYATEIYTSTRVSSLLGRLKTALSPRRVNERRGYYFYAHARTSAPPICIIVALMHYIYCANFIRDVRLAPDLNSHLSEEIIYICSA